MKKHSKLVAAAALALSVFAVNAGDVTGKVTLKGTPPANKKFKMDPLCGRLHKVNLHEMPFYKVASDGGLGDVVVVLKGAKGSASGPVVIDQVGCVYVPYIATAQTGQTITVKNSDPLMHNVHPTPKNTAGGNKEANIAQPVKGMKNDFKFPAAETFLRFKCDVHPWMYSYVSVLDHGYFAVTDENGKFSIAGVPDGAYEITARHRKVGTASEKITVKGGKAEANFTLELK